MPDFVVTTGFKAMDKHTPVYNKMGGSAERYGIRATKSMQKISRAQSVLISKAKLYAGIGLGLAVGFITREFINFDQAITAASAKFPGLADGSEKSRKTLEQLKLTARKVGATTENSATQAAQGIDYLAMAGFSAQQSMALLPGVTNLATVANVDLARSTDIASDAIGAFGMMTENTAQLTKNFTRINDVMAATITATNTNMEDLFESVKYGGPVFTAAGQTIETFNAIAGRMASNSYKGSMAGTALRAGMLRIASEDKAIKTLSNLGIATADSSGKMRNMIDILSDIEIKTKSMTDQQRLSTLKMIFGTRAVAAYSAIIKEGIDKTKALEKQLQGSTGAAEKMANVMRQSLLNQLKTLLSTIIELGFKFIDAFSKQGGDAINSITNALRVLGPVFSFLGKVVSKILPLIPYLIGGFLAYKIALKGVILYQKIMIGLGWIKYLIMMRKSIWAAVKMTKAWAIVQKIFNVIMSMNPIGLIIIGIAALIAYIVIAIKYWDKFGASMMILLGPIGMVVSAIMTIYKRWEKIKSAFTSKGIIAGLKQIGLAILDAMVYPLQQFLNILGEIPGVGKYIKKGATALQSLREQYLGAERQKSEIIRKRTNNLKRDINDITRQQQQVRERGSRISPVTHAPNEAEARARRIDFRGRIDIAGAPEGTEIQSQTTGAPAILLQLLGAQ